MDAQLRLIPRVPTAETAAQPAGAPAAARPARRPKGDAAPGHEPTEAPVRWRIDESARERGRAGISRAREVLRQSRRPLPDGGHVTAA